MTQNPYDASANGDYDVFVTKFSNPTCCVDMRGNVDGDELDNIDIADLVYFVNYSFSSGPEPPCIEEADIDGSGALDISDIVYLVNYMFASGVEPVTCH